MNDSDQVLCTAFDGDRRIASGELARVAVKAKEVFDHRGEAPDGSSRFLPETDFADPVWGFFVRSSAAIGMPRDTATHEAPGAKPVLCQSTERLTRNVVILGLDPRIS